ncbi:MAG: hypothetical protein KZQ83_11110 [gamma proteobacterium symbiont of Taylorina sp.]|nr:hypothetical protein [gamma proteobacterium symbiont of Taylorina sp.]
MDQKNQYLNKELNHLGIQFSHHLASLDGHAEQTHQCNLVLLQALNELHHELIKHQKFHDAVDTATARTPIENQSWIYQHLSNTLFFQVGLITLYHFMPIPLHDHPGAYGAQQVVSGKVHIRQYHPVSRIELKQSIVSLKTVAEHHLNKDECAVFQPLHRNLHDISSFSQYAILLSMMIHPYKPEERSWYFPMELPENTQGKLYNRLKSRASPSKM